VDIVNIHSALQIPQTLEHLKMHGLFFIIGDRISTIQTHSNLL